METNASVPPQAVLLDGSARTHQVVTSNGAELVIRVDSVDKVSVDWMEQSDFWRAFASAPVDAHDAIIDLGAHIGSFAVPAALRSHCPVYAYEPDAESFRLCTINALLNGVDDRVACVRAAAAGTTGRTVLYQSTESWGHTLIDGGGPFNALTGAATEVDCYSLADVLLRAGDAKNVFLKFNIEGAEDEVFAGTDPATLQRIRLMVGELHADIGPAQPETVIGRLQAAGFEVTTMPCGTVRAVVIACRYA